MRSPELLIPFIGGCSFGSGIAGLFRRHCCEITRHVYFLFLLASPRGFEPLLPP